MTENPSSSGSSLYSRQLVKDMQSASIYPVETFCSRCGWACKSGSCPRCKFDCNTPNSKLPEVSKLLVPTSRLSIDIAPEVLQVEEAIPELVIGQGKALDIPSSMTSSPATSTVKKILIEPTPSCGEPSGRVEQAIGPDNISNKVNATKQTNLDSHISKKNDKATRSSQRNWSDRKHPNSGELVYAYSDSSSEDIAATKRFLSSSGSSGQAEKTPLKHALVPQLPLKIRTKQQGSCKIEETDTEEEF